MSVSNRVMGNVNEKYVPSTIAMEEYTDDICDAPTNMESSRRREGKNSISEFDEILATTATQQSEWKQLKNPMEWARLQKVLISTVINGIYKLVVNMYSISFTFGFFNAKFAFVIASSVLFILFII
jgi:hypothetical protein